METKGQTPEVVPAEPKVGWRTFALTDSLISAHLDEQLADSRGTIMMDEKSRGRGQRKFLKPHKDSKGYFVRVGCRGSSKQYLGRCNVTYIDGAPVLFSFTLAERDAFEAKMTRRFNEKHGIES